MSSDKLSPNQVPESGDWAKVAEAVNLGMKDLDWSLARLSRESGISEHTIRYIREPKNRQRSILVAISGALGRPHDYLEDVLSGKADPKAPPPSPAEMAFIKNLLEAEVSPLKQQVDIIDGKVTDILGRLEGKEPPGR